MLIHNLIFFSIIWFDRENCFFVCTLTYYWLYIRQNSQLFYSTSTSSTNIDLIRIFQLDSKWCNNTFHVHRCWCTFYLCHKILKISFHLNICSPKENNMHLIHSNHPMNQVFQSKWLPLSLLLIMPLPTRMRAPYPHNCPCLVLTLIYHRYSPCP